MNLLSRKQKKSPKAKIEPLQSSEIQKESFVSAPETTLFKATLHRSCKTCPLSVFIEAYCNSDYSGLGQGTETELMDAWKEIYFDWATLLKSEQSEYIFDLSKQIGLLELQIVFIENSVHYLQIEYDEDIAGQLRAQGYDPSNLPMIISLAKRLVFDLEELNAEYKRLVNTTSGKPKSEDEWMEDIAMLSKFQQYNIDPETTTVKKYAAIFNLFLKQNKAQDNG